MILDSIIQEAKKEGLDKIISGRRSSMTIIQTKGHKQKSINRENFILELPLQSSTEQVDKIMEIARQVKEKINPKLQIKLLQKLSIGNKLPNFGHIKKVFEQGTAQLSAKQGQVLLIDVWATWCGPCQNPMAHNQQMLVKNNWGDKVRIVGVSVDDDVQSIRQRVQSKGWKNVQHLTLGGWDKKHSLIKSFAVSGIPFLCLVDTHGTIDFIGHPNSINLQERINQLIKGSSSSDKKQQQAQPTQSLSKQAANKIAQTVGNKQFFLQRFGKTDFISTKIELFENATEGKVTYKATIQVYVNEQGKNLLQQYEKILPSKDLKFEGKVIQQVVVPQLPQECTECKSQLKYPLYWCKWSENKNDFRCRNCVEKKIDQQNYHYKNNSILLMQHTKRIGTSALGKNIQPNQDVNNLRHHMFGCNGLGGCKNQVGDARYICLGCGSQPNYQGDYIDLCETCFNKYLQKDPQVIQNLNEYGDHSSHPFLRILYNVKGYFQY